MNARMHIDGCHFFAWVYDNPQGDYELTWYERDGTDLELHADQDDCPRCRALLNGSKSRQQSKTIELPDDSKLAFFTVLGEIGKLDSEAV